MQRYAATFPDASDNGHWKSLTVRFDEEPEDREIQALMLRYNATECIVRPL